MTKKTRKLLEQIETLEEVIQTVEETLPPEDKRVPGFVKWCGENLWIRKRGAKDDEALIPFSKDIWRHGQKVLAAYFVRQRKLKKPIRLIIHKIRQRAAASTMCQAWMLYLVHHLAERKAAVAAHLETSSREIFQNVHRFIQNMPKPELKPMEQDRVLKQELKYDHPHNSSFICASAGSTEVFRGAHIHYFHGSEVAFYQNPDQFFQAIASSFPDTKETWDSCVIMESTAKGRGFFYDKCKAAQEDPTDEWDFMFFSWKDEPDCQIPLEDGEVLTLKESEKEYQLRYGLTDPQMKWALHMVKNVCFGKWEVFHQEYPVVSELAFDYTGHPLFDRQKIKEDRASAPEPIFRGRLNWGSTNTHHVVEEEDEYGPFVMWERPQPGAEYFLSMDVGEGLRADYTEIPVIKRADGLLTEVALWRSNRVKPDAAGIEAFKIGCHYNWGLMVIERNGPGLNTAQVCRDGHTDDHLTAGGYPNLYYRMRYDRQTQETTREIGFLTSRHNKDRLLSKFGEMYDKGQIIIRSLIAFDQMAGTAKDPETEKWLQNHKDPETGFYHDDSVMSLGIGCFVISGEDKDSDRKSTGYIPQPKREEF